MIKITGSKPKTARKVMETPRSEAQLLALGLCGARERVRVDRQAAREPLAQIQEHRVAFRGEPHV